MSTVVAPKGLEGIVATSSSICWIDGDAGVLSYRGIDIHELAQRSTFEETTYLLWFVKLPNASELADFTSKLAAARKLDPKTIHPPPTIPPPPPPFHLPAPALAHTPAAIPSPTTGATGALKAPLPGGANEAPTRLPYAIEKASADPVEYVKQMFPQKKKTSGFGPRVYHTEDPRATHLRR